MRPHIGLGGALLAKVECMQLGGMLARGLFDNAAPARAGAISQAVPEACILVNCLGAYETRGPR